MAGVSFTIDDKLAQETLSRLERAAERPAGAYDAIGAHFVFSTQRNIQQQVAPDGVAWPRLSPRTAAQRIGKRRRGTDHILRVTNRLYSSISYQALPDGVEWGTNIRYGRIHQLGGVIDMPERQGTVRLKKIRGKGNRFVRKSRPGTDRDVTIGAHQVRIPARPYLGISAYDREAVPAIVADYLRSEVGQ